MANIDNRLLAVNEKPDQIEQAQQPVTVHSYTLTGLLVTHLSVKNIEHNYWYFGLQK